VVLGGTRATVFDLDIFECRNATSEAKKKAISACAAAAAIVTLQEDVDGCGDCVFGEHRVVAYAAAGRLRNAILAHRSVEVRGPCGRQDRPPFAGGGAEDRCAAAVRLEWPGGRFATLATTHLAGGRYDDRRAVELKDVREQQLLRLVVDWVYHGRSGCRSNRRVSSRCTTKRIREPRIPTIHGCYPTTTRSPSRSGRSCRER